MSICLRRRDFVAGLGGTAAWPLAARGQQPRVPVIGYLSGRTAESDASMLVAFRRGLGDIGYAEGRNVAVEYRFARRLGVVEAIGHAAVRIVLPLTKPRRVSPGSPH